MKIVTRGFDEVIKNISTLDKRVRKKHVRASMRMGLKPIKADVEERVPQETGDLAASIKIRSGKRKVVAGKEVIRMKVSCGYEDTFYGKFVNYGTINFEGAFFVERAFEAHKKTSADITKDELWKRVQQEFKKGGG